jgi:hypothetical protein
MKLILQSFRIMSVNLNKEIGGISNGNEPCALVTSDVFVADCPDGIMLSLHGSL